MVLWYKTWWCIPLEKCMGNIIGLHKKTDLNFFYWLKKNPLKISTTAYSTKKRIVALNPLMRLARKICGIWHIPLKTLHLRAM
jgi:hypothetical protein